MIIVTDFAMVTPAVVGAIVGASVTGAFLRVLHRRRMKSEHSHGTADRPICLYSHGAPVSAGIVRVSRRRS